MIPLALAACAGPRPNQLHHANVALAAQQQGAAGARLERDAEFAALRERELQRQLELLRARHRAQAEVLDRELGLLHALEQDLAAARRRKAELEPELAALRAVEQQHAQKERLLVEQNVRLADVESRLAAAQARLAELGPRLTAVTQAEVAVRAALEALRPPAAAGQGGPPAK